MKQTMLTTIDNPYDPFDNYGEWYAFDFQKGYHTSEYLARVCVTSSELSEKEYQKAIDDAIDSIVTTNVLGIYKKVSREFPDEATQT